MNLENKVVVITGASQGLGACLAKKLAEKKAKVALVARTEELLEQVKKEIEEQDGTAECFVCDIRSLEQIEQTVDEIVDQFSEIDVLVNNAGVWTDDNLEKEKPELRGQAFKTNALGHINFTYQVLPYLKKQNYAHVVNVISSAGTSDLPSGNNTAWKTYGATKWAMRGFSKALRNSLTETDIKLTEFYPAGFESNLYENAERKDPHNQPWMMETKDVADCIFFALTRPKDVVVDRLMVSKFM